MGGEWERQQMHITFLVVNLKGRNIFGYVFIDERLILKIDHVEIVCDNVVWTEPAQECVH
jgi:hypothetical protein